MYIHLKQLADGGRERDNMTTVINFKTDKKIKDQAQKIAKAMGLNLSDVLNIYLRHFVVQKEIYINLNKDESRPSKMLIDAIRESKENMKNGDISPAFSDAESAVAWLNGKNKKLQNGKTCQ
jgi:addiction module RelB/DinJ family antitoxin